MIVTCHDCQRQISFRGDAKKRALMARLFGWVVRGGRYFCASCGLDD